MQKGAGARSHDCHLNFVISIETSFDRWCTIQPAAANTYISKFYSIKLIFGAFNVLLVFFSISLSVSLYLISLQLRINAKKKPNLKSTFAEFFVSLENHFIWYENNVWARYNDAYAIITSNFSTFEQSVHLDLVIIASIKINRLSNRFGVSDLIENCCKSSYESYCESVII